MKRMIKHTYKTIIGVLFLSAVLTGCLKKSDVAYDEVKTYLSIMHLASSAPAAEVYINNNRETNSLNPGSVFQYYAGTSPGQLEIKFKKASTDSLIAAMPVTYYDSLRFYSIILFNDPQNTRAVRAIRIEDDFSGVKADQTSLRFLNMSPDIASVSFSINDELVSADRMNADIANNAYLRSFQNYLPGNYTIRAKLAGTDSVLVQTSAQLTSGNAFTILLQGVSNNTGNLANSSKLKLVVLRATN